MINWLNTYYNHVDYYVWQMNKMVRTWVETIQKKYKSLPVKVFFKLNKNLVIKKSEI